MSGLVIILAQRAIDRFTQICLRSMAILNQSLGIDPGALRLVPNTPYINITAYLRLRYYQSQSELFLGLKKQD